MLDFMDVCIRSLACRRAILIRHRGLTDPETVEASRKLASALFARADDAARLAGLDELDRVAIVRTGELPPGTAAA
jgi:hypothetical protein